MPYSWRSPCVRWSLCLTLCAGLTRARALILALTHSHPYDGRGRWALILVLPGVCFVVSTAVSHTEERTGCTPPVAVAFFCALAVILRLIIPQSQAGLGAFDTVTEKKRGCNTNYPRAAKLLGKLPAKKRGVGVVAPRRGRSPMPPSFV